MTAVTVPTQRTMTATVPAKGPKTLVTSMTSDPPNGPRMNATIMSSERPNVRPIASKRSCHHGRYSVARYARFKPTMTDPNADDAVHSVRTAPTERSPPRGLRSKLSMIPESSVYASAGSDSFASSSSHASRPRAGNMLASASTKSTIGNIEKKK